jgi:hypothetical protein
MNLEQLLIIATQLSIIKANYTILIGPNKSYILKID